MIAPDPIIPRHIIWADPERTQVKVSPCGKFISYLAPHEGNLNLWIAPSDDVALAKPVSASENPIRDHTWAKTSDFILYHHDNAGDENWQLHGVQLSTGNIFTYTEQGLQARILQLSATCPTEILITLNQRNRHFTDVMRVNLLTQQMHCVYENNAYWDFIADKDLNVRFGLKIGSQGGEYVDLSQEQVIARVGVHDVSGLHNYPRLRLGISSHNKLYYIQSLESNTTSLMRLDLNYQKTEKIAHHAMADICDVLISPLTNEPIAFALNYERKKWQALDGPTGEDFDYLEKLDNGDIDILSQSANNARWLVSFVHDNGPITYYLYDRHRQKATYLFDSHSKLKNYPFTKMHPRKIKTSDDLICVSYLSLPRQWDVNEGGVPFAPLPLVLLVHGGPNSRDYWGFNPTHQWLANRGYAVLSVNYRASIGFGKAHLEAGHGEWAGKIQEDLLDATAWAVEQGITTPDKIAIMGRSFGGFCTLVGLAMTPDVFCCGIDIVGPSNLETLVKHFPPYWKVVEGVIHEMLGCDPNTPEGISYLRKRSPLYYAHQIKKPLLIGHGVNDVRVLQEESDQMVKAMQDNGIPVTYAIFSDEGHQITHPGNRMAFYALAERFLAKVLGGLYEENDNPLPTSMVLEVDDFGLSG